MDIFLLFNISLKNKNLDKDIKGYEEKTPLLYAYNIDVFPIIEYLLSNNANMEAIDKYKRVYIINFLCKMTLNFNFLLKK